MYSVGILLSGNRRNNWILESRNIFSWMYIMYIVPMCTQNMHILRCCFFAQGYDHCAMYRTMFLDLFQSIIHKNIFSPRQYLQLHITYLLRYQNRQFDFCKLAYLSLKIDLSKMFTLSYWQQQVLKAQIWGQQGKFWRLLIPYMVIN